MELDDRGAETEEDKVRNKRFMQSGRKLTPAELNRKAKIVDSANFPPRTMPIKGEGYFFFQGPSPKTSVQKDLPSFFSAENFENLQIAPQQLAVTATGLGAAALLAAGLVAGDPGPTGSMFMNAPAELKQKAPSQDAAAKEKAKAEAAAAKAAAEKAKAEKAEKAKADAAAAKAAAEKAKAEKAEAAKAEK